METLELHKCKRSLAEYFLRLKLSENNISQDDFVIGMTHLDDIVNYYYNSSTITFRDVRVALIEVLYIEVL